MGPKTRSGGRRRRVPTRSSPTACRSSSPPRRPPSRSVRSRTWPGPSRFFGERYAVDWVRSTARPAIDAIHPLAAGAPTLAPPRSRIITWELVEMASTRNALGALPSGTSLRMGAQIDAQIHAQMDPMPPSSSLRSGLDTPLTPSRSRPAPVRPDLSFPLRKEPAAGPSATAGIRRIEGSMGQGPAGSLSGATPGTGAITRTRAAGTTVVKMKKTGLHWLPPGRSLPQVCWAALRGPQPAGRSHPTSDDRRHRPHRHRHRHHHGPPAVVPHLPAGHAPASRVRLTHQSPWWRHRAASQRSRSPAVDRCPGLLGARTKALRRMPQIAPAPLHPWR